jgi:hypothetical protein
MNIKSVKHKKVQKIEEVKGSFAAFSGGDRGQYHKTFGFYLLLSSQAIGACES